jgi:hypothetical protein
MRPVPVTDSATFNTPEANDEDLGDLLLVTPPSIQDPAFERDN